MTGQDLITEMLELSRTMEETLSDYRAEGVEGTQADREYRVSKAKEIARLKSMGWPATTTEAMTFDNPAVADAYERRGKADVLFRASWEHMQLLKRKYDFLKAIWERER